VVLNSIDLVQSIGDAFPLAVRERLSGKIGLSVDIVQRVIAKAVPALVISSIAQAATPEGATRLFSVMVSALANARIGEQFGGLISSTAGLMDIERAGDALVAQATDRGIASLSDPIATECGVPEQAAYVLTAVAASVLFGLLRRHVLLEQLAVVHVPALFSAQVRSVAPHVTDRVAAAVGAGNARSFIDSIAARLDAAGDALRDGAFVPGALARAGNPGVQATGAKVRGARARSAAMDADDSVALAPQRVTKPTPRRVRRAIWLLYAALAGVLAFLFIQRQWTDMRGTAAASLIDGVLAVASSAAPSGSSAAAAATSAQAAMTVPASSAASASPVAAAGARMTASASFAPGDLSAASAAAVPASNVAAASDAAPSTAGAAAQDASTTSVASSPLPPSASAVSAASAPNTVSHAPSGARTPAFEAIRGTAASPDLLRASRTR
jgi:hypothetical protein